ncbi:MAG: 2-amino-4-hydroxy-6-hydroxymethyldihydropteridine diphosphokinase [Thermoanaerobaculia bacterium]|nr:2-amino-4-hydroxy-6-hydroxymethyldihydropteridine diphosphokinase [Thermoanaerobaculia bacterium]
MPVTVVIALGSNRGDRGMNLRRAVDALSPHVRVVRVSSVHETAAVDAPVGSPAFLNMVVVGYTSLSPFALLDGLQSIEEGLGRVRGVRNAPRTIDLDLIFYDALRMRTPRLTIPHPRYERRRFVLEPLAEVWPGVKPARRCV